MPRSDDPAFQRFPSALATPRAGLASCQGDRSQDSHRLLTVTSITKWKSLCLYWARPIRSF